MLRAVRRRLPARVTNLTLLVALALAFATGAGPRRTALAGRVLLGPGGLGGGAAALDAVLPLAPDAAGLPGAPRRFPGSYEPASFAPASLPATIWLADAVPHVDTAAWRLT